jgi:hypothetical protein
MKFQIAAPHASLVKPHHLLYETAAFIILAFIQGAQNANNLSHAWICHPNRKYGPEVTK